MYKQAYLGEEGIETMDLLSLFDKCVVLGNTFQGEFVHQVSHEWLNHVLILFISYEFEGVPHSLPRTA
jgi:hypothetical protein